MWPYCLTNHIVCSREDILEAIPDWIRFPSCPLQMVAPLVFRSWCSCWGFFHLEYSSPVIFFQWWTKARRQTVWEHVASPVLVREEREGEYTSLKNYLFNLSFLSTCLLSTYGLFCCWTNIRKILMYLCHRASGRCVFSHCWRDV